jgi:hypothetical protein
MIKRPQRLSQIRRRLQQIPTELGEALDGVIKQRALLRGYVYRSRRRCGKPSCHCAEGELHEALVLATSVDGRRTTRSLSGPGARKVTRLAKNYRRFRDGQRRFRRGVGEALRLIGELEELLAEELEAGETPRRKQRR